MLTLKTPFKCCRCLRPAQNPSAAISTLSISEHAHFAKLRQNSPLFDIYKHDKMVQKYKMSLT